MLPLKDISRNGIYVDTLTGLPNFFKFINTDSNSVFGNKGTTITLDFIKFTKINEQYGRAIGDLCLRELSKILCQEVDHFEKSNIYRMGGDEFIIILNGVSQTEASKLVDSIKSSFSQTMAENQVQNLGLHSFIFNYTKPITSSEFLNILFEDTLGKRNSTEDDHENWTKLMIETLINRIKETISLFNNAYKLALTDDVSELPNHRSAKIYLDQIVKDIEKCQLEFSVLFIDGDNLKRYNNISYQVGNEMIKDLSIIIRNSLRKEDQVFRWLSGDEFLVILNKVNQDNVSDLAERIRSAVESETQKWRYPVTISIGVSSYPADANDVEDLIMKAEKANFLAKSLGKNRVVLWNEIHRSGFRLPLIN